MTQPVPPMSGISLIFHLMVLAVSGSINFIKRPKKDQSKGKRAGKRAKK